MSHTLNVKIRIQILLFIFQIQKKLGEVSDQFYRVLYELNQKVEIRFRIILRLSGGYAHQNELSGFSMPAKLYYIKHQQRIRQEPL